MDIAHVHVSGGTRSYTRLVTQRHRYANVARMMMSRLTRRYPSQRVIHEFRRKPRGDDLWLSSIYFRDRARARARACETYERKLRKLKRDRRCRKITGSRAASRGLHISDRRNAEN